MKKNISFITILSIIFIFSTTTPANAFNTTTTEKHFEYLQNGDYFETSIETTHISNPVLSTLYTTTATQKITKTKTGTYKTSDDKSLWYVSITGTFTFNGSTSRCIKCSHNAGSYAKSWFIKSVSSTKNDNSATATVIAIHSGNTNNTLKKQITISCSKNGNIY